MKFSLKNANDFGWEGLKGRAYNSQKDFEVTGEHGKVKTTRSDRVYFVIDGKGEFTVDDENISVEKDDVVIIPKNTPYNYRAIEGTLKLFLVHTPAYLTEFEVKL